jgi:hypothetical protein
MANALTDPKGSLANFPPNTMPAANTTHASAQPQTYAMGTGKDANDVQPGLKGGQTFQNRPDAGSVKATAGAPGSFTGSPKPDDFADANSSGVKPSGAQSAWTTGQYVQGNKAGAAGQMNWTGTAWATGVHA